MTYPSTNYAQDSKTPQSFSLSIWKLELNFRKLTLGSIAQGLEYWSCRKLTLNSQLWDGTQLGGLITAHINGWTLLLLLLLFYLSVLVTPKLGGSFTVVPRGEVM